MSAESKEFNVQWTDFTWNIKCIIFTAIIAGGYWFLPHRNIYILTFLLWFPYLAMAWYDYLYDCEQMLPTNLPLGRLIYLPFKPPEYQQKYKEMPTRMKKVMNSTDKLTVVLIVGALVTYLTYLYINRN